MNGLEFRQGIVAEMDHTPEEIYDAIRLCQPRQDRMFTSAT